MSTHREIGHRTEEQDHTTTPWVWIAIAVVAVLAIAGIAWIAVGDDGTSDIDIATELANTWGQGWEENDPDMVGSVFTDDGIHIDLDGKVWTKEQHMQDVRYRGQYITKTEPVTDVTATDDGTFTYVADFTAYGTTDFTSVIEIELDGDLATRIEWLSQEQVTGS
ncbi:hypothetical protein [Ilumatobacter sp.]|uniref:hypothetical protein n=1 Tax=Ilumatobacter sp. TaxID=1967498 RepID=UPI003AF84E78